MANSLLDFVMSLVRDPAAAAAYAENPAQAIADANLTDVTSADVSSLIPVVSESVSASGADAIIDDAAGNVWASGAATAAFDAFDDHVPTPSFDDVPSDLIEQPLGQSVDTGLDDLADAAPGIDASTDFALIDDVHVDDIASAADDAADAWAQPLQNAQSLDADTGFDAF